MSEIIDWLSDIGVENTILYKGYFWDHQGLAKNEKYYDKEGNLLSDEYKKSWKEEDDCYYWLGTEVWQNLPVFSTCFYDGMTEAWAPIQVLFTNLGVEKVQILYNYQFHKDKEIIELKPFEEVIGTLAEMEV